MKFFVKGRDKKGPVGLEFDVNNQFNKKGSWITGTLHCHVNQMGDPQEVCSLYKNKGFSVQVSSDYRKITKLPASEPEFITINGAEVTTSKVINFSHIHHIICLGLSKMVPLLNGSIDDVSRLVNDVEKQGGITIMAHPSSSNMRWSDLYKIAASGITGFEISNRLSWKINGKSRSDQLWYMLLNEGIYLAAIGSDDAHSMEEEFVVGKTWTGILAEESTPEGVLDAIRCRRTYASEGPVIKSIVFNKKGTIDVECSKCIACHFISREFGARTVHADGFSEYFSLDLSVYGYRIQDWISVSPEDEYGRRAWSSAIPVKCNINR